MMLVVWNIFFYFPYSVNNHPNWLSYFSRGFKPPTSYRYYGWRISRIVFVGSCLNWMIWMGGQVGTAIVLWTAYLSSCCLKSHDKIYYEWRAINIRGRPTRKIENYVLPKFEVLTLSLACAKQCSWAGYRIYRSTYGVFGKWQAASIY